MNLTDSLKHWLADYIFYTDYEPGKSGTFEQRQIENKTWNDTNWTAEKGGWNSEIISSPGDLIKTGSWQFLQNNGFWGEGMGVADAIVINRIAKRILYYPNNWKGMGFSNKELAGYESGPYDHKIEIKSIIPSPECKEP
jgi:hypothetical protein